MSQPKVLLKTSTSNNELSNTKTGAPARTGNDKAAPASQAVAGQPGATYQPLNLYPNQRMGNASPAGGQPDRGKMPPQILLQNAAVQDAQLAPPREGAESPDE